MICEIIKKNPKDQFEICLAMMKRDMNCFQKTFNEIYDSLDTKLDDILHVITSDDYEIGTNGRHNYDNLVIKRKACCITAKVRNADILWFIDVDIRVPPGHWPKIKHTLSIENNYVALIPYPIRWMSNNKAVICVQDPKQVAETKDPDKMKIVDADSLTFEQLETYELMGGGMGCTAIKAPMFFHPDVQFCVGKIDLDTNDDAVVGEDIGWFLQFHEFRKLTKTSKLALVLPSIGHVI